MRKEKKIKQILRKVKKEFVLPLYLREVITLLGQNPTTNFVAEKMGKSSKDTSSYISKLIKLGYVRRLDRGLFKVLRTRTFHEEGIGVSPKQSTSFIKELANPPFQKKKKSSCLLGKKVAQPLVPKLEDNYYRLHGLEIELKINKDVHGFLQSCIFADKIFTNIKTAGGNGGNNFDYGIIKYLITKNKLFAFFPNTWEITGHKMSDLSNKLYESIFEEINKLGRKIRKPLIKEGRLSFDIVNMHIAISNCGVVREFKNRGIRDITVYDSDDGKARFIMDFSHGIPELEAIHPEHVFDDAMEAKYFTSTLKDGEFRKLHEKSRVFFNSTEEHTLKDVVDVSISNTKLLLGLIDVVASQVKESKKTSILLKTTAETVNQLAMIMKLNVLVGEKKATKKEDKEKGTPPYYMG